MSGPVNGVSPNSFSSGFEIIDSPSPQSTGKAESMNKTSAAQSNAPVEKNSFLDDCEDLGLEDIAKDGKNALKGATVTESQVPETLADKLRDAIPARSFGFKNFLSAVGRGFMNLCHAVRCVFTGGALWSRRTADHADFKATGAGKLPGLPTAASKMTYGGTPEEIGAALGLRGKITLTPFPTMKFPGNYTEKEQLNFRLYGGKDAGPKLSDIKQDPSRQDCWFLSSITSLLRAKGPEAITRLIQPADTGDFAIVRMGAEHYRVPLAEVRGNGGSTPGVSDSAPWVKLLETAMAMHLANHTFGGKEGMDYRSGALGLCALSGYDNSLAGPGAVCAGQPIEPGTNMAEKMTELKGRLAAGDPVVLSSPPNMKLALASGISPGHAVALLDVNVDRQVCTVLDPYGRTRNVAFKDLVGFTVTTVPHEKKDEIESTHNTSVSNVCRGKLNTVDTQMMTEGKADYEVALETGEVTQETVDEAKSMLRKRRNLTCDVGDVRHTFTLQDNAGEGNCFFYAALGGVDGKAVTLQSSLELRERMAQSTSELLGAAEQGQAKGLTKTISAEGKIRYEARYTDSEGKEGVIDVTPAVKEYEQGDSITNYKEVDTLNGAFLAHHLKRPVIVHTHIQEFVDEDPIMLEQRFDFDLMTGEKFDPNLKPVEIYYTGGQNGGHFQTVIEHQQEVVA